MSQVRDEEMVYIGAHNSREKHVYHTNQDCMHLNEGIKEKPRKSLDDFGYRECKTCSGEADKASGCGEDSRTPLRWRVDDE